MKRFILVITIIFGTAFSSFSQDSLKTCVEKIKTGKFKSVGAEVGSFISRTSKEQFEFIKETQTTVISSVRWISDTEYELKIKKLINYPFSMLKKGDIMLVKVIECNETTFKCRVWFKKKNFDEIIGEIEYEILETY